MLIIRMWASLPAVVAAAVIATGHIGAAVAITSMYVLGDSSVDCGDNTPFYGLLHGSLSLFPCNGSDSTLLPHLLAKKMGLPKTTPFYTQNGTFSAILNGVNFGSASATILHGSSQTYQTLNQQLRQAFETIQLVRLHLGEAASRQFVESAVFYLSFGKDDFIDYLLGNWSVSGYRYSGREFTHILVRQMTNAVRNLYDSNVRKFICAGVVPLGCSPQLLLQFDRLSANCVDDVNILVEDYNARLEESLAALGEELRDTVIIFCDVYAAMMELITNPLAYGIEDVANACCGEGGSGEAAGCVSPGMACLDASTHVWWDLYNPTPAVNAMVANSAWSGRPLSSVSRPITVRELISP
ncbi:GDSL esterase/lipase At1g71250-like [Andrographis paniculata]|uniref:GDSL esterase/lipase At1g71250-like n=1 Tax=Andrographis paniculata TaxID=175694 RepID=UPI0021E88FF0|nr:GDSL esterase/lipase At1g71250-like [Andrographis paniculata]